MRKNFLSGLLMAIFTTAARQIRIFTCAVCLLIMTVASTASAELTTAQSALGGITLGAPSSYVRSVYGEGIFSRTSTGYKYQYNGAFIQFFVDGGPATVMSVDTWKNNGLNFPTPNFQAIPVHICSERQTSPTVNFSRVLCFPRTGRPAACRTAS